MRMTKYWSYFEAGYFPGKKEKKRKLDTRFTAWIKRHITHKEVRMFEFDGYYAPTYPRDWRM